LPEKVRFPGIKQPMQLEAGQQYTVSEKKKKHHHQPVKTQLVLP